MANLTYSSFLENSVDFVVKNVGLSACHPQSNPKLWPGPEGQNVFRPATNCLRLGFLQVKQEDLEEDYENLVNRVQLHSCRTTYCLKQMFPLQVWKCRFGYPLTLHGFKMKLSTEEGKTFLDEMLRSEEVQNGAEFEDGDMINLRNHCRLVLHIPELLSIWRGNMDQKENEERAPRTPESGQNVRKR